MPHFTTKTKDERGHGLAVHLLGVLLHELFPQLRLFTMNDNHTTGSNHIVEVIRRVINDIDKSGYQRSLLLQLDNFTREKKNKYLMA